MINKVQHICAVTYCRPLKWCWLLFTYLTFSAIIVIAVWHTLMVVCIDVSQTWACVGSHTFRCPIVLRPLKLRNRVDRKTRFFPRCADFGLCLWLHLSYRAHAPIPCTARYCFTNSVLLSNVGIVAKRLLISSNFFTPIFPHTTATKF